MKVKANAQTNISANEQGGDKMLIGQKTFLLVQSNPPDTRQLSLISLVLMNNDHDSLTNNIAPLGQYSFHE